MFSQPKTLTAVKRLGSRARWAICNGSWQDNEKYCKKDGDWCEWGVKPLSQKRKGEEGAEAERERWKRIRELAKEGKEEELEEEFPRELTLYEGALRRLHQRYGACQDLDAGTVNGMWIYGPAGTGKTYHAMHNIVPREEVYVKDLTKWWDGYDPSIHKAVVIDDMDIYHKSLARDFKIWTQEYEFQAQFKGGYMKIRPPLIIVTSNYRINEIWDDNTTCETMWRRFKCYKKMTKEGPLEED